MFGVFRKKLSMILMRDHVRRPLGDHSLLPPLTLAPVMRCFLICLILPLTSHVSRRQTHHTVQISIHKPTGRKSQKTVILRPTIFSITILGAFT
jgi:hypothetical protein